MDRLGAVLRAEWVSYWRRLFRGGNAAKNNLFFMALIALAGMGKYISFLRTASGNQVWYLLLAVFLVVAASLRNDGPVTAEGLARFPLTAVERFVVKVFSAIVPPWSWIVLVFALGIFKPLSKSVPGIVGGVVLIAAAVAAGQIPLPGFRLKRRSSRGMTLFRKEVRYILALPEHTFVLLVSVAFGIYLIGGEGLQADAFRAVLGILSIISATAPMNTFAMDGSGGIDRYGLLPVSGALIVRTKNLAFLTVVAAQRAPIIVLAVWRLGAAEAGYGAIEAASLALLTLAWGNFVSVRHPAPPGSEPLVLDGLVGFAASALPAAATIGILRGASSASGLQMAGLQMIAMVTLCTALWYASLLYAGGYFTRNFDRIRTLLVG